MRTLARFVTSAHKYIIFAWIAIFVVMTIFAIQFQDFLKETASKWTANTPL